MRLLALDTASGQCSAALLLDGAVLTREELTGRDHARLILPMVASLLAEAGLGLPGLDAIAFGRGPGSFTGLRIAASVTQGLAFGADLPVLPVSDLAALALQAVNRLDGAPAPPWVLACMDARMHEVYWSLLPVDADGLPGLGVERVSGVAALLDTVQPLVAAAPEWLAAGRGLEAYAAELAPLGLSPARQLPQAEPHAREVARLGALLLQAGGGLPAEQAVPVYLRDQVAQPPRS